MIMKAAFLDRDGTIIKDYPDEKWSSVKAPEFFEDSFSSLKGLIEKGYELIIITNQYIINEGFITENQFHTFHKIVLDTLNDHNIPILDTFYCPHARYENCDCRKPKTGLIKQAMKKYPHIDLEKSILIGDSECDAALGNKLNLLSFLLHGDETVEKNKYSYINVNCLKEVLDYLDEKEKQNESEPKGE